MKNNLTLLIDGNWLLMSRMFVMSDKFAKNLPPEAKEAAIEDLQDMLARSIMLILSKNQIIDNLIIVADGGSWRKELPIPKQLEDTTYKGNRSADEKLDWDCIYEAFGIFLKQAAKAGITVSHGWGVEGDDWMWYWTRRLNEEGINTMIWTSDCDLKQLVQVHKQAFTIWYNDKTGLTLPQACMVPDDPMDFFMAPPFNNNILMQLTVKISPVNYINPDEIAINKILCGDSGDNIKSIIRYKKNNRTYRFSQRDYEKLIKDLGIATMDEFLKNRTKVVKYITSNTKFQNYHFTTEAVQEMLDYNTKLVWLNESVLPSTVLTNMAEQEYKQIDVNDIKLNYRILTEINQSVEDIFADAI